MATVIAVGDLIEAKIGTWSAQQAGINVLHYRVAASSGSVLLSEVAIDIDLAVASAYKAWMNSNATYYGVSVRVLGAGTSGGPVVSHADTGTGTSAGQALPTQVAGLITWRTGGTGRSARGRSYIPFPTSDAVDSISLGLSAFGLADLTAIANALYPTIAVTDGVNNATLLLVIKASGAMTTQDVEDYTVQTRFGTQRRRGGYGATNPYPPF